MSWRYVTIPKAAEETGYTKRAIESKIDRGIWLEGREYIRAPDNRILIDREGVEAWAAHQAGSRYTMAS